jgi:hypothetical protein
VVWEHPGIEAVRDIQLWVTSPDVGLYRRSRAVFGLDRAASAIAGSGRAWVQRGSIQVLRAHQEGHTNAVAVHTPWVTRDQMLALVDGQPGDEEAAQEHDRCPLRDAGELDEHLRARYPLSARERVAAACVIAGLLAFEVWFFFLAGLSLPS